MSVPTFHDGFILGIWTAVFGIALGILVARRYCGPVEDAPPRDQW